MGWALLRTDRPTSRVQDACPRHTLDAPQGQREPTKERKAAGQLHKHPNSNATHTAGPADITALPDRDHPKAGAATNLSVTLRPGAWLPLEHLPRTRTTSKGV